MAKKTKVSRIDRARANCCISFDMLITAINNNRNGTFISLVAIEREVKQLGKDISYLATLHEEHNPFFTNVTKTLYPNATHQIDEPFIQEIYKLKSMQEI